MNRDAIEQVISNVNLLLESNKIDDALMILKKVIAPISDDLEKGIRLQMARNAAMKQDNMTGIITADTLDAKRSGLVNNIMQLMKTVDTELDFKKMMGEYNTLYTLTSDVNLEKIHGSGDNLVPINWIYKCIEASRSVCQVRRSDGNLGTGWMLEDGWMMTNFHVIPNKDFVSKSKVVFDFEEGLNGAKKETIEYLLDPEGALFSSIMKLDYAFIKVIDNPSNPIADRGYLEVDTFSSPQKDDRVAIIQHPKGKTKHIALTENKIVNVDGNKLFYMTDTEKGSSGSPVLNKDWKVIGLHHAGKTEEEGGLVVDSTTGEKAGANEGLLIKAVMEDIEKQRQQ